MDCLNAIDNYSSYHLSLYCLLSNWLRQDLGQVYFNSLCYLIENSIEIQIEIINRYHLIDKIVISEYEWNSDLSTMQFESAFSQINQNFQLTSENTFAIMYCFYNNSSKYFYQIKRGLFKDFILSVYLNNHDGSFSVGCPLNISAQVVLSKEDQYVDDFFWE